jgi:hypothetical protein
MRAILFCRPAIKKFSEQAMLHAAWFGYFQTAFAAKVATVPSYAQ